MIKYSLYINNGRSFPHCDQCRLTQLGNASSVGLILEPAPLDRTKIKMVENMCHMFRQKHADDNDKSWSQPTLPV